MPTSTNSCAEPFFQEVAKLTEMQGNKAIVSVKKVDVGDAPADPLEISSRIVFLTIGDFTLKLESERIIQGNNVSGSTGRVSMTVMDVK